MSLTPDPIPRFGDRRRSRIGLLGGSFNPAHRGHRMIAEAALRRLRLDQVWLMVSPGNPLKSSATPLRRRLHSAQSIARPPAIVATAIEARLGTVFTRDTIRRLRQAFPRADFVWLTGADNFAELHRWHDWRGLLRQIPVAIFPRPGFAARARRGKAAQSFAPARVPARAAAILAEIPPPAWLVLPTRQDHVSSSAIRALDREESGSLLC